MVWLQYVTRTKLQIESCNSIILRVIYEVCIQRILLIEQLKIEHLLIVGSSIWNANYRLSLGKRLMHFELHVLHSIVNWNEIERLMY